MELSNVIASKQTKGAQMKKAMMFAVAVIGAALITVWSARAADEHKDMEKTSGTVSVTGEVLDMACYIDHGAHGEKHAGCAKMCIESGLPVGIKTAEGAVYLVIGEHKPMNKELAPYAAKTITIKGKLVERDGIKMIANAEIVSK
jgi:hypothetical protein